MELEEQVKANTKAIADIRDEMGKSGTSLALLKKDVEYIASDVSYIKKAVEEMQKKPQKRVDLIINSIITFTVTSILAVLGTLFFTKK